jgi:hypothetical protein
MAWSTPFDDPVHLEDGHQLLTLRDAARYIQKLPPAEAGAGDRASPKTDQKISDNQMTVWIYVDTSKQVGDVEHLKVFATQDAAEEWFKESDPEGVAFEYRVIG